MKRLRKEGVRYVIGVLLFLCVVGLGFSPQVRQFVNTPVDLTIFEGSNAVIEMADVTAKGHVVIKERDNRTYLHGKSPGSEEVLVKAGPWPVKAIDVSVLPSIKVIPGGQSIGVKLNTEGVLVVGHHLIETAKGQKSPGEFAGIEVGDRITKINGIKMHSMNEVAKLVQDAGEANKELTIEVLRNEKPIKTVLKPERAKGDHLYRLGLYIRDSAAGVGTMTFYEPQSMKYGALGHVISDVDTRKPISVHDGQIMRSSVTSISKGLHGEPGEKLASIAKDKDILGSISKNSSFGVFGQLDQKANMKNGLYDEPMAITTADEVKEGPAKILTVLEGEEVEQFDVEIVSSVAQNGPATKGMVIKVTDKKLLQETGGIVQGMSGSPIIQDGKLIGAVTHVFVNDPTSGYGCHIGWMLEEAGIHTGLLEAKAS